MKKLSLVLALAFAVTITTAVLADGNQDAATLNQISGYRDWTRVNPDPVEVSVPVSQTAAGVSINSAVLT